MGQSASLEAHGHRGGDRETLSDEYDFLHEQIRKHSKTLRQLTLLTYDDLHNKIAELNALSSKYMDCNGKQLLFEVKAGTDSHVLWKGTVRIKCIKLDPVTQKVEKSRELYLKQFLQVYNTMQLHITASHSSKRVPLSRTEQTEAETSNETRNKDSPMMQEKNDNDNSTFPTQVNFPMDASILLNKVAKANEADSSPDSLEECCICMETKPEVSLPCTHSYCLACIEQWNVDHKTCPICRDKLENTDDTWVLEDLPNPEDVSHEIQKSLFGLTR